MLSAPYAIEPAPRTLKSIAERLDVPRAFDDAGLDLARFMARQYLCTLGEALSAVVLADAIPRVRDSFVRRERPNAQRLRSVPTALIRLVWDDLTDGFSLEQLVRHPEARRIADRTALLGAVRALVRAGALARERRVVDPRTSEYRVRVLEPGDGSIRGKKAEALAAFVREHSGIPRADAVLAGFNAAVITRTVRSGAVLERYVRPHADRKVRAAVAPALVPTPEQARAVSWIDEALAAGQTAAALLYGVTASGKTLIYIHAIERALREGGRAIVLVPEISLTPQTAQRFEAAFGDRVAVLHSALSERERFDAWQACARGEIDVVVGARSAVFAPLDAVRLLIVDESHDPSYKQEVVPRYQTVAVAHERMKRENGVLLLGSATPSLESYAAAKAGRIVLDRKSVV